MNKTMTSHFLLFALANQFIDEMFPDRHGSPPSIHAIYIIE
jgi:hypothetical protein